MAEFETFLTDLRGRLDPGWHRMASWAGTTMGGAAVDVAEGVARGVRTSERSGSGTSHGVRS